MRAQHKACLHRTFRPVNGPSLQWNIFGNAHQMIFYVVVRLSISTHSHFYEMSRLGHTEVWCRPKNPVIDFSFIHSAEHVKGQCQTKILC